MKKTISIAAVLGTAAVIFSKQKKFGKRPSGVRLQKLNNSLNYRNGKFWNKSETPAFTEGANYFSVMKKFLFEKDARTKPLGDLPSIKTNLHKLDPSENILVWFGHSSYFMQLDGKKFLVDPVFSGSASPLPGGTKSFAGSDIYTAEDIPEIDYLFITHDHWDHLDFLTIVKLKQKIKQVITGLGTGEHFRYWGFSEEVITEKDWDQEIKLEEGFSAHTVTARHFSGRGLIRNPVLWTSFTLKTPSTKIFIGGDSGYDTHFSEIGKIHGPFDLAILENGQYNKNWKLIHMMPEETFRAAKDLRARKLLPVHHSKFALSTHAWDEPLERISQTANDAQLKILTPMIGEKVEILNDTQSFSHWWKNVE